MTAALNPLKNKFFSWRYEIFMVIVRIGTAIIPTLLFMHAVKMRQATRQAIKKGKMPQTLFSCRSCIIVSSYVGCSCCTVAVFFPLPISPWFPSTGFPVWLYLVIASLRIVIGALLKISSCHASTYNKLVGNQTARDFFWFYFPSIFKK